MDNKVTHHAAGQTNDRNSTNLQTAESLKSNATVTMMGVGGIIEHNNITFILII